MKRKGRTMKQETVSAAAVDEISEVRLVLRLAGESMRRTGAVPPALGALLRDLVGLSPEALQAATVPRPPKPRGRPPKPVKEIGPDEKHTCPSCHKTKNVLLDFGLRKDPKGIIRKQSNCRMCRNGSRAQREAISKERRARKAAELQRKAAELKAQRTP